MTLLARVRVGLTGWSGGPGVNTLIFSPGSTSSWSQEVVDGTTEEVQAAYSSFYEAYASGVTITVESAVGIFESASGELVDIVNSESDLTPIVAPTGTDAGARSVARLIRLGTSDFINGRRLQGRLFISPLQAAMLGADGNFKSADTPTFEDAFDAMTSGLGTRLAVWHRPSSPTGTDGSYGDVNTVTSPLKPASLISRRD